MNLFELAYYAGLFDGEGSVTIVKNHCSSKHPTSYRPFGLQMVVSVANNNKAVLEELQRTYGGHLNPKKYKCNYGTETRLNYTWGVVALQAKRFLTDILPFVKIKRPQIEIALEFQERTFHTGKVKWLKITNEEWEIRCRLREKIRSLNGRKTRYPVSEELTLAEVKISK